ncbi:MAG: SUMF1/EgtB/PvdO family nonheme iron enzyme [Cytophagales bacterium]|nr:SUMF1/EgtB/PvdO family nonheme iron enzyme [Cytophagales bacterium]
MRRTIFVLLVFLLGAGCTTHAQKKKKTCSWPAEMANAQKAVLKDLSKQHINYTSRTIRENDLEKISLNVSGVKELSLLTLPMADGARNDDAIWLDARLIDRNGKTVWLDDFKFVHQKAGYGRSVQRGKFNNGRPFISNSKKFEHGIYCYAGGELVLKLDKKYKRFEATLGTVDYWTNRNTTVQFKVLSTDFRKYCKQLKGSSPEKFIQFSGDMRLGTASFIFSKLPQIQRGVEHMVKGLKKPAAYPQKLKQIASMPADQQHQAYYKLYEELIEYISTESKIAWFNPESMQLALDDMKKNNPGLSFKKYQSTLDEIKNNFGRIKNQFYSGDESALKTLKKYLAFKRELMTANPLVKNAKLLVTRHKLGGEARRLNAPYLGTPPTNWQSNSSLRNRVWHHNVEIAMLSDLAGDVKSETLYAPKEPRQITDLDLHWNADKLLFSSVNKKRQWHVYELDLKDKTVCQKTSDEEPDIDYYEGIYLPNGKIMMCSTVGLNGVPCVSGDQAVANLTLLDPETKKIRRLNFGQDNDWDPTVLDNGRIMYLRWEYTDNTHYFSRVLMHMNPDGTGKKEYYGGNSYWPNGMFDARQLPGKDNQKFVAIVSGHHGVARSGQLVMFDPSKGRHEADGVVQELPFRNKVVKPIIKDKLVDGVWPQFLKPYPLSEKYFFVIAKLSPKSLWGLYLVDVFDNLTLIKEYEGEGISEVTPLEKKTVPQIIPEKVRLNEKEATLYIQDIYEGRGLPGVPRGTVKKLRVIAYEYAYRHSPSNHDYQGIQAGWDTKRVLGTVPVEKDGSAIFKVPANTPISLQPIDEEGRAVQLMRSWLTAMPGEILSCIGCHEEQNTVPVPKVTVASRRKPHVITPPKDGVYPFTFDLEIQPILDRKCAGCHNGESAIPNFADKTQTGYSKTKGFSKSYLAFHPFINRQGPEADIHVMKPMEFHASTSELVRKLKKGHHNVKLSKEEWEKLYTWIDLNAPYRGVFRNVSKYKGFEQISRRRELALKYNNLDINWEQELSDRQEAVAKRGDIKPVMPEKTDAPHFKKSKARKWPFTAEKAKALQDKFGRKELTVEIAKGINMHFVKIPKGQFVMGSNQSMADEMPASRVKIDKPFWMATMEVTNEQYRAFFPKHDSRFIGQQWKDHVGPGYPANKPKQPVIRVSWKEAMQFCETLSQKLGVKVTLPTEAQWEWACRSGSAKDMWFMDMNEDFGTHANLADTSLVDMAVVGVNPKPMRKNDYRRKFWDFLPKNIEVNDGQMIVGEVGQYKPNPWGLYDMHGNVAEWTRSDYKPFPYRTNDGRNDLNPNCKKVAKGGSWKDRKKLSKASSREAYLSWQKVFNVGFRVIIETENPVNL